MNLPDPELPGFGQHFLSDQEVFQFGSGTSDLFQFRTMDIDRGKVDLLPDQDIDLVSIAEVHFPTHAIINYSKFAKLRNEASACHSSQGGSKISGGLMGWLQRLMGSKDRFMREFPKPAPGEPMERDLFQGIS